LVSNSFQVRRWNAKRLSIEQRKARVKQRKAAFIASHVAGLDAEDAASDMDDE
jgi:hypothetical protein